MKQIAFLLIAIAALAALVAIALPTSLHADDSGAPIFVTKIPPGFRDWKLISVAHEEGNLNSFAAVLGNDVAIKVTARGSFRSRMARSLLLCITVTSRRRKTIRS